MTGTDGLIYGINSGANAKYWNPKKWFKYDVIIVLSV